jgi:hypothetical protein
MQQEKKLERAACGDELFLVYTTRSLACQVPDEALRLHHTGPLATSYKD